MNEPPPPIYIDTPTALAEWAAFCASAPVVAVDTESDSFHHYREKVCLVQMSAGGRDAVIDPLALGSLAPLAPLFAEPRQRKVFHDACYDLICLRRDFGFSFANLWDTMLASRLLGAKSFGLATILQQRYGYVADKRLQRSDWTQRPLSDVQLSYARYDTHFLERLAAALEQELAACGRLAWAEEEFTRLPEVAERVSARNNGPASRFGRLKGIRQLSPEVLGRALALFEARERLAARLDRPPFKIFSDSLLLELAARPPRTREELQPRPGLRRAGVERFGDEILAALASAKPHKGRVPVGRSRRRAGRFFDPALRARYQELRALRSEKAASLGLDPEVLLGNAPLEELARLPAADVEALRRREELQGWRAPILVEALVELLGRTPVNVEPGDGDDAEEQGVELERTADGD